MKQVIYADVLISINLFINYFILLGTAKFIYLKFSRRRVLLGAFLGSLYSLYIFLPRLNFIFSLIIKFIMAMTIIWVSFGIGSKKTQIKTILCFYSMNFAFSGIMFALWCLVNPSGLIINNGIVYFNISPLFLLSSTVLAYIIIQIINRVVGKKRSKNCSCSFGIQIQENILFLNGEVDTCNNLKEPFSNLPVVVVSRQKIKDIVPGNILNVFSLEGEEISYSSLPQKWRRRVRMIPFKTVSGEGILPAFKPDSVIIRSPSGDVYKDAYIAICPDSSFNKELEALVSPELVE